MKGVRVSGRYQIVVWLGGVVLLAAGCLGSRETERPPDEQFGHRYETPPDDRSEIVLREPSAEAEYFYYPAIFDTVHVRSALFDPNIPAGAQRVPIEVLVKGAFPDTCTELHDVEQERAGHLILMQLTMRRPKGAVCTSVVRPYRFYVMLEGLYGIGDYTLKINGTPYAFQVRVPEDGA